MPAIRHLSVPRRRLLLALFVVALLARGLMPAGWMPVADAAGPRLALCDGASAMRSTAHAMPATPHRGPSSPDHHQGAPDHPCAFAGAVAAIDLPVLVVPAISADITVVASGVRLAPTPGRGLAAPPPPPTGPPAFA